MSLKDLLKPTKGGTYAITEAGLEPLAGHDPPFRLV
jgi:hypothetical protein